MYNKTKGVMGNNSDIKIRVRQDLYEKCRFENVNDDEGDENRCGIVIVVQKERKLLKASEGRVVLHTDFKALTRITVTNETKTCGELTSQKALILGQL